MFVRSNNEVLVSLENVKNVMVAINESDQFCVAIDYFDGSSEWLIADNEQQANEEFEKIIDMFGAKEVDLKWWG